MRIFAFILFVIVMLASCGDNGELPKDDKGREDFEAFYNKFYTDTTFQYTRIEFPMLGTSPDGSGSQFFWTEENWKFIKGVDVEDKDVEREIIDMGEVMRERIVVQKRFMIELMYSLVADKWYLTSYSGIRDIAFFTNKRFIPKRDSTALVEDSTMMEQEMLIEEE